MPAGSSWPTMAMTRAPCSTTSGTRTSSTRSDTPKWRPTGSRTFGGADLTSGRLAHLISRLRVNNPSHKSTVGSVAPSHLAPCLTRWRREGWHRLGHVVYHLGICRCIALGDQLLNQLDGLLDLLVAHSLDAPAVLELRLARHQQRKYFEVHARLVTSDLLNRFLALMAEVQQQRLHELLIEQVTRAVPVAVRVSGREFGYRTGVLILTREPDRLLPF